ncbi:MULTISPECIES: PAAR domain-containing protein [unclassified Burkholderia]|uniref:PAAR domain-containing protein n=1 Tax=unclassified Burkholderia TaxID=2613784 RepID=UPI00211B4D08|nr:MULTISPECIES: PAAR domain-containing protein [unclassified Burkholderia]MDN7428154.1 PAAR domain-containing protein [Burkholderia sp. AU45388]
MKSEQTAPTHLFATIGALTERGGRVTNATSGLTVAGLVVARVGDVVTYEDGSEAVIMDGAGEYAICSDKPFALVGSRLSNGDRIVETLQRLWGIHIQAGETAEGLPYGSNVTRQSRTNDRRAARRFAQVGGGRTSTRRNVVWLKR